jgi:hypothetical protein
MLTKKNEEECYPMMPSLLLTNVHDDQEISILVLMAMDAW